MKLEVTLNRVKETKGTQVYATEADGAPITQLYIRKSAFPSAEVPKTIVVTVEGK